MTTKTLEQYLIDAAAAGQIDHTLRATTDLSGNVIFYIHPQNASGETADYLVVGNGVSPIDNTPKTAPEQFYEAPDHGEHLDEQPAATAG